MGKWMGECVDGGMDGRTEGWTAGMKRETLPSTNSHLSEKAGYLQTTKRLKVTLRTENQGELLLKWKKGCLSTTLSRYSP